MYRTSSPSCAHEFLARLVSSMLGVAVKTHAHTCARTHTHSLSHNIHMHTHTHTHTKQISDQGIWSGRE